ILENTTGATRHLHSLPPMAFHRFRQLLNPASGLQSYQFRELEFLCGLRDTRHVEWVQRALARDSQWEAVRRRLDQLSLAETFDALIARRGIDDLAALYAEPARDPVLYALADALSVLDHRAQEWRFVHIELVERTIGLGVMGTGGTTSEYLQATLSLRFFPALWEARNQLTGRVNASEVEPEG
ncbi:MAG: hypothetical protein IT326_03075, partial [Anaerolineae bacterium]|nr:hypothetical protein [Anaerolineae bacterium]